DRVRAAEPRRRLVEGAASRQPGQGVVVGHAMRGLDEREDQDEPGGRQVRGRDGWRARVRARNAATAAQARLDWTIVWRKKRPPTMSPRAATKVRIAGCDTSVHDPPSPTRRRSSTAATGASSGLATSATTSGWTPSAPTSHRL